MAAPSVYAAINGVATDLSATGIPKNHVNKAEDYAYRSIDDVLISLSPLLVKHRVCLLPRVLERHVSEHKVNEGVWLHVALLVAFDLTSVEDGSCHTVQTYGEALDATDKATAKAMSAAYKTAVLQTFCIPVTGTEDPDRDTHKLLLRSHQAEPLQGWDQWAFDLQDIVGVCESTGALDLVQERHRRLLHSLSRERPELYAHVGKRIVARFEELAGRGSKPSQKSSASPKRRSKAQLATLEDA